MLKLTTIASITGRTLEYHFECSELGELTIAVAPGSALLRNPVLSPLPNGEAVLIGDYTTSKPTCYHVPASLTDAVRRALNLKAVTV